jgi:hypothetical protein
VAGGAPNETSRGEHAEPPTPEDEAVSLDDDALVAAPAPLTGPVVVPPVEAPPLPEPVAVASDSRGAVPEELSRQPVTRHARAELTVMPRHGK